MGTLQEARIITKDWLATIVIGFLVTSYWRGTWTLFDIWLCDQPHDASLGYGSTFCYAGVPDEFALRLKSGWISCGIGWGLTVVSVCLMWAGLWRPEVTGVDKVSLCDLPNYNYTYRYEKLHLTTILCRYFRCA